MTMMSVYISKHINAFTQWLRIVTKRCISSQRSASLLEAVN